MKTMISKAKDAAFTGGGMRDFFQYRDLGVASATEGRFVAQIIKAVPGKAANSGWHIHHASFRVMFILKGWIRFWYPETGEFVLRAGDCIYQAADAHKELEHSDDLEILEIATPADFFTQD